VAKQKTIIPLTGKWGNQIGYMRNGKFFVRSAPEKVRQNPATRRAAARFGAYSRKAKLIRHAVYTDLDVRCDSTHINRLNKVLIAAAGNHEAIKGFRFNQDTGIDRFFTVIPHLSKDGVLHIPAQDIVRYKGITTLELKAIAVRIDFDNQQVTGTDTVDLSIDAQQPFDGTNIPLYVPGEGTLILTLQVKAMLKDGPSGNKQFLAADIITVITPPPPKPIKIHTHLLQVTPELAETPVLSHTPVHQTLIQRE